MHCSGRPRFVPRKDAEWTCLQPTSGSVVAAVVGFVDFVDFVADYCSVDSTRSVHDLCSGEIVRRYAYNVGWWRSKFVIGSHLLEKCFLHVGHSYGRSLVSK